MTSSPIGWNSTRECSTSNVFPTRFKPITSIGDSTSAALFGTSYRFTTNLGYFSQQLIDDHREYGFDPALEYVDLYIPQVAEGLNIRIGRFISIPGIEAQLAPNNYVYTHSLLYAVDPFTDTGILGTFKLNDRWLLQLGVTASHDVAPWSKDAQPSATACVSYTFNQGNDNLYPCANGINRGRYAYNNLQMFDITWYHKFNALMAYGQRGLVHVSARRTERLRSRCHRKRALTAHTVPRGRFVASRRNGRRSTTSKRSSPPRIIFRFAPTSWMT